uniref:Plastid lipid-associated protein/fibrillin conserved domain-containing protein n=1 Tax=Helicotheca tamesis TaxID=374047 RepID=A0A7S2IJB9_9STRA|mmetsp:Transcript_9926/g.13892  ORF Transcript_9926/g.13892 Transcript_9926/m.13892 type:complete len:229 (+) Transcript_9926:37-723(+)
MAWKLPFFLLLITCAPAVGFLPPTSRCNYSHSIFSRKKSYDLAPLELFRSDTNTAEETATLKDTIRQLARGTSNGIDASKSVRDEIATLSKQLVKMNPTKSPALSEKLDGSWALVYTTNPGSSAGKLGPFTGDVEQAIRITGENPEYVNYVRLGGGLVEGMLSASWDVLSKKEWLVKFETLQFRILGIKILEKDLKAEGTWKMEYLDDDFRILYAEGGNSENIYILSK